MANSVETQTRAKMGLSTISAANPYLDGSGTIKSLIEGSGSGTLVKTLIIKAQDDTAQGMIRLFVKKSGGDYTLLNEVYIPATTRSGRDLSEQNIIPLNYLLQPSELLAVSTENADTFNIIAEALDISYSTSSAYVGSTLEFVVNAGTGVAKDPNSSLDGTGDMVQAYVAGSGASGYIGSCITSIIIQAQQSTAPGMVRLFIQHADASTPVLFTEVVIPPVVQSGTTQAFSYQVIEQGSLCIPPDYSIWASTEKENAFSVVLTGSDWLYA